MALTERILNEDLGEKRVYWSIACVSNHNTSSS